AWALRPRRVFLPSRGPDGVAQAWALRDRVFGAMVPESFAALTPAMMLSPHCLHCGKALEDPASVARWIGPVCWGSSELPVPRVVKLATVTAQEAGLLLATRKGDLVAAMALGDFYEENGESEKAETWRREDRRG